MLKKMRLMDNLPSVDQWFLKALEMVYQKHTPAHCFIAEIDPLQTKAQTLCYLNNGQQVSNIHYELAASPCQVTISSDEVCYFPHSVQSQFPHDDILKTLNAQSYLAISLRDLGGETVGILVCIFSKPIELTSSQIEWLSDFGYFILQKQTQQQAVAEKQQLVENLNTAQNLAKIGNWRWDVSNDVVLWSKEIYRIFEMDITNDNLSFGQTTQFIHHDDCKRFNHVISQILTGDKDSDNLIYRIVLANGQIKYLHQLATITKSAEGEVVCLEGTIQDISKLYQLNLDKKLSDVVLDHSSESIMITDSQNKIILVNKAMERLTGYSQAELLGKNPSILSSGLQNSEFYHQMWQALLLTGSWKGEVWNKRKNGQIYPEELALNVVKNEQDIASHYVAIFRDITNWKATEQELLFFANCDPLTSLLNRRSFIGQLEQHLDVASDETLLSILFIDVDKFKTINDSYGHETGDLLLCELANRLSKIIGENDLLCRYGGDEFTLLISDTSLVKTQVICDQIQRCFNHLFKLNEVAVDVTASIGVAMYPDAGTTAKLLLRHANHAMHNAKNDGRNCISFHDTLSQKKYQHKLELKKQLKLALEQGQLHVYYQPIVDIEKNQISKFEALVRWPNGDGGFISPNEFIPIAQEYGLIHLVGQFVLEQACLDLKHLHRQGYKHISFSINRSISEFFHDELEQESIATVIAAAGLPYDSIVIEITESTALSENRYAKKALSQLKARGIKIALDDFCTGYSSLNYLIDYDVDIIKIDRSFVKAIKQDKNSQILTSTVIELASKLGIEVIAEGVETDEQLSFLRQQGCRYIQGFYFSPAVPIADCLSLLGKYSSLNRQLNLVG